MSGAAGVVEQVVGALILVVVLGDIFLTVLYVRAWWATVSRLVSRVVWRCFRAVARRLGRRRSTALSFGGPLVLLAVVGSWAVLLTLGAALVVHPGLGTSVVATAGETPRDLITALYAGGASISIVGGAFAPRTGGFRLFYLFDSLVGMSAISLTLTYLMQVYAALQARNGLAIRIHLATAETGDAAELLAGLIPEDSPTFGTSTLASLADTVSQTNESHHFYPVLFYFRFREPYYAVSHWALVMLDMVTLMKSGLDDAAHAPLKESAAVSQIWRGCMLVLPTLADTFVPARLQAEFGPEDPETLDRWRRRYAAGLRRLRQAGVRTTADEAAGFEQYAGLRRQWNPYISALAPALDYAADEIDPAGCAPEAADARDRFQARRHLAS